MFQKEFRRKKKKAIRDDPFTFHGGSASKPLISATVDQIQSSICVLHSSNLSLIEFPWIFQRYLLSKRKIRRLPATTTMTPLLFRQPQLFCCLTITTAMILLLLCRPQFLCPLIVTTGSLVLFLQTPTRNEKRVSLLRLLKHN